MRPTRRHPLHPSPGRIVRARYKIHFQPRVIRQRQHRVMGLHSRIKPAKVDDHALDLRLYLNCLTAEFLAQQRVTRSQQRPAMLGQQSFIHRLSARQILIEQQVDAVSPSRQVIHRHDPWREAPGSRLPMMVQAIVVNDDPVEPGPIGQHVFQRFNIRLPGEQRFDGLLRIFPGI